MLQHLTAEKLYGARAHLINNQFVAVFDPDHPAAWAAHALWVKPTVDVSAALPVDVSNVEPCFVYLNRGVWVAECPTCHHAQAASETDPRFFCLECENFSIQGKWRQVIWPKSPTAEEIEGFTTTRLLLNQNWLPGESLDKLAAENLKGGDV